MPVVSLPFPGSPAGFVLEKRLSSRERSEPEAIARLRTEAELLVAVRESLGGRVLPRLVASGEDERGPWLHLEPLGLPTLAARLESGAGPLSEAWFVRALPAALGALAELHDAADTEGPLRLVHGDPSPANTAFDEQGGRAALLDLDLAVWRASRPRDGAFRGTIAYAAPEVARGATPDARSDLFGIAATLLHALTGEPPRRGASYPALLASAAEVPVLDAARARALATRSRAHAVLVACLALAPEDRPASAREALAAALC